MKRAASLLLMCLSVALCRCGADRRGAPATPADSPAAGQPEPAGAAPPAPAASGMQFAPPPPPPGAPPSPEDPRREKEERRAAARADLDRAEGELEAPTSDCAVACRALASMERATLRLCSLADDPDDRRRCDDARQRLTAARHHVQTACGACS